MRYKLNRIKTNIVELITNYGIKNANKLINKIKNIEPSKQSHSKLVEYEFLSQIIDISSKELSNKGAIAGSNNVDNLVNDIINIIKSVSGLKNDKGGKKPPYLNKNKFIKLQKLLYTHYNVDNIENTINDFRYNHAFKDLKNLDIIYDISKYMYDTLLLKKKRNLNLEKSYLIEYNKIINASNKEILADFGDINLKDLADLNANLYRQRMNDIEGFDQSSIFISNIYDALLLHNKDNSMTLNDILPSADVKNPDLSGEYTHLFSNFIAITNDELAKINKGNGNINDSLIELMKLKSDDKSFSKPIIANCTLSDKDISHSFNLIAIPNANNLGFKLCKIDSSHIIDDKINSVKYSNVGNNYSKITNFLANIPTINKEKYQNQNTNTSAALSSSAMTTLLRESSCNGDNNLITKLSTDDGAKNIVESIKKQSILDHSYLDKRDKTKIKSIISNISRGEKYDEIDVGQAKRILKTNKFLDDSGTTNTVNDLLVNLKDYSKQDAQNKFFRKKLESKIQLNNTSDVIVNERRENIYYKKFKVHVSTFGGNSIEY